MRVHVPGIRYTSLCHVALKKSMRDKRKQNGLPSTSRAPGLWEERNPSAYCIMYKENQSPVEKSTWLQLNSKRDEKDVVQKTKSPPDLNKEHLQMTADVALGAALQTPWRVSPRRQVVSEWWRHHGRAWGTPRHTTTTRWTPTRMRGVWRRWHYWLSREPLFPWWSDKGAGRLLADKLQGVVGGLP